MERCTPEGQAHVDEDCDGQVDQAPCAMVALAGGWGHSIGLFGDGTVWTWGYNGYGQLGDGSYTTRYQPAMVQGLTGVVSVAAGSYHSLAVRQDGTVWAWGYNNYGQLGDGRPAAAHYRCRCWA